MLVSGALSALALGSILRASESGRLRSPAWGLALICLIPGILLLLLGLAYHPNNVRSARILGRLFPEAKDSGDLAEKADLLLPDIQFLCQAHHLMVFSRWELRVANLKDVQWLYPSSLLNGANLTSYDVLVVCYHNGKRQHWQIPRSSELMPCANEGSLRIRPSIIELSDYIRKNYPDIEIGYAPERELEFLRGPWWLRQLKQRQDVYANALWAEWLPWEGPGGTDGRTPSDQTLSVSGERVR